MTDQQRLTEALDRFDMVQAADILELVSQTKDGLFTGSELLTKLERTLGTTFGTDADLGITEGITELPGIQSVLATRPR
jgi:hypothetical protein